MYLEFLWICRLFAPFVYFWLISFLISVSLCVVFILVCREVSRVLEQGNGVQEEEDSHLDKFAKENCPDCGPCRHVKRTLEGSQRN